MIINENICGWANRDILYTLATYAKQVPSNGIIVELGTFVGRSAFALGMNKKDSVKLYCYDKWNNNPNIIPRTVGSFGQTAKPNGDNFDQLYSIDTVQENLKDVKNLHLIQTWLPLTDEQMIFDNESIDLIYIDAGHTYAQTNKNIEQWYSKIKKGGVLYFDDYNEVSWPGVVQAVDKFCKKYNEELNLINGHQAVVIKKGL